jgi:tRNA-uridine 2-sulfurtransferase
LHVTNPKPLYVIELDPEKNRVIVGDESALEKAELTVDRCNWIPFAELTESMEVMAKIRYNHPGVAATVTPGENGSAKVKLHIPQRAVTPGQACVFYQDDLVIGGGWITRG